MGTSMHEQMASFWFSIMEKLSLEEDDYMKAASDVVRDICEFFKYQSGFIYTSDHEGIFHLNEYLTDEKLPASFNINEKLDAQLAERLVNEKQIAFTPNKMSSDLEKTIAKVFQAEAMFLLPVIGEKNEIAALVGMADWDKNKTQTEMDIKEAYTVFVVIVNHIRLQLNRNKIEQTEKALSSIVDNMGVDIYINDFFTHEVLYVNKSMAAPYGGVAAMQGNICWQVLYDGKTQQCDFCPQFKLIDAEGNPTKIYSWNYERPFDGSWFRVLSAAFRWTDDRIAHIVSSIDITENQKNEDLIRTMAERDMLTGLSNRHKLLTDCEKLIKEAKEEHKEAYVMFFDLDKFKQVNDVYGHRAGDELLGLVGGYLQEQQDTKGICYRYGGDEFVVLCFDHTEEEVITLARGLVEHFKKPWNLETCEAVCNASVGIAKYPQDADTVEGILSVADAAMYQTKAVRDGSFHLYKQGKMMKMF